MILLGLIAAGNVMAQNIESVMINNWDGNPLEDNQSLEMVVGEQKTASLTIYPQSVDPSTMKLAVWVEGQEEDQESPFSIDGLQIVALRPAIGWLEVLDAQENVWTSARIIATANPDDYIASGLLYPEGEPGQVCWSIDKNYRLQFWADALGCNRAYISDYQYGISEVEDPESLPWKEYREMISEVVLDNLDFVDCSYAFSYLTGIHYVKMPSTMEHLGELIFLGCGNLRAIEVTRFEEGSNSMITMTTGNSLVIEKADPDNPESEEVRVDLIIVNNENSQAMEMYMMGDYEWSRCGKIMPYQGYSEGAEWTLERSETSGVLQLTISPNEESETPLIIPNRTENGYDWDLLGEAVEELVFEGSLSYIGEGAMENLPNVQKIQFRDYAADESNPMPRRARKVQPYHPIDSIHLRAFSESIQPWKFALGDPNDGPIYPPKVVYDNEIPVEEAANRWAHIFSEWTVLSVPNLTITVDNRPVRVKALYEADPIWGKVFNRIDDHTVEAVDISKESAILKWLPQEGATAYTLRIRKLNCENCDSIIVIPARGPQGLIDWEAVENMYMHMPAQPGRAPKSDDDQGGMTLTINIGGGDVHNTDFEVSISSMDAGSNYSFEREVLQTNGVANPLLMSAGIFATEAGEGIEDVLFVGGKGVYDLLGRPMGTSLENQPDGVYIMVNDGVRTKVMLRK